MTQVRPSKLTPAPTHYLCTASEIAMPLFAALLSEPIWQLDRQRVLPFLPAPHATTIEGLERVGGSRAPLHTGRYMFNPETLSAHVG